MHEALNKQPPARGPGRRKPAGPGQQAAVEGRPDPELRPLCARPLPLAVSGVQRQLFQTAELTLPTQSGPSERSSRLTGARPELPFAHCSTEVSYAPHTGH